MMETRSIARYQRTSPRKCRLAADQVRGLSVGEAIEVLGHMPHKGARLLLKTVKSALANAEHNHGADMDLLRLSRVTVDQGPAFKRHRARARGRVNMILKRTSHITVVLSDEGQ